MIWSCRGQVGHLPQGAQGPNAADRHRCHHFDLLLRLHGLPVRLRTASLHPAGHVGPLSGTFPSHFSFHRFFFLPIIFSVFCLLFLSVTPYFFAGSSGFSYWLLMVPGFVHEFRSFYLFTCCCSCFYQVFLGSLGSTVDMVCTSVSGFWLMRFTKALKNFYCRVSELFVDNPGNSDEKIPVELNITLPRLACNCERSVLTVPGRVASTNFLPIFFPPAGPFDWSFTEFGFVVLGFTDIDMDLRECPPCIHRYWLVFL